jgi:hypothetical protein
MLPHPHQLPRHNILTSGTIVDADEANFADNILYALLYQAYCILLRASLKMSMQHRQQPCCTCEGEYVLAHPAEAKLCNTSEGVTIWALAVRSSCTLALEFKQCFLCSGLRILIPLHHVKLHCLRRSELWPLHANLRHPELASQLSVERGGVWPATPNTSFFHAMHECKQRRLSNCTGQSTLHHCPLCWPQKIEPNTVLPSHCVDHGWPKQLQIGSAANKSAVNLIGSLLTKQRMH